MGVNEQQITCAKTQKRRTIIILVSIFFYSHCSGMWNLLVFGAPPPSKYR